MIDDCPGEGKCHGCAKWCDACGDVDDVCDHGECNVHRCVACRALLTAEEHEWNIDWFRWCFTCSVASAAREAVIANRDEIVAAVAVENEIAAWRAGELSRR
jgi:hypothetical protein